jgi:hypothetical protein
MAIKELEELQRDQTKRAFYMTVGGLDVAYYSHLPPVATGTHREYLTYSGPQSSSGVVNGTGLTDQPYTFVQAITDVGNKRSSLDILGGVVSHEPLSVRLSTGPGPILTSTDPVTVFGRVNEKSSQFATQATTALAQTDSNKSLTFEDDASGLTYPRLLHIGAETVRVLQGDAATPATVTVSHRGVGLTMPHQHVVDTGQGDLPKVTSEIVVWKNRPVTLYMTYLSDGQTTVPTTQDWVEIYRGYIDQAPQIATDGLSVSLEVMPWTAVLDRKIGVQQSGEIRLKPRYHYFADGIANRVVHVQSWLAGYAYRDTAAAATVVASGGIQVNNIASWTAVFDVSLPLNHPRKGRLYVAEGNKARAGGIMEATSLSGGPPNDTFDFGVAAGGQDPQVAIAKDDQIQNVTDAEFKYLDISSASFLGSANALVRWPRAVLDKVVSDWQPGTSQGSSGALMDVGVSTFGGDIRVQATWNPEMNLDLGVAPGHFMGWGKDAEDALRDAQNGVQGARWENSGGDVLEGPPSTGDRLCWYGFNWARPLLLENGMKVPDPQNLNQATWQDHIGIGNPYLTIMGFPDAFYQEGERYIFVDQDVPANGLGITWLRIESIDDSGEEQIQGAWIISSTLVNDPDTGNPAGYALELHESSYTGGQRIKSFGMWPGRAVKITYTVVVDRESPTTALLKLLSGTGGEGINGVWDLFSFGAGIPNIRTLTGLVDHNVLDLNSVLAFPTPPGELNSWSFHLPEGGTVKEIIQPMLITMGAALGMRLDDQGRMKVSLFPISQESAVESAGTIADGDWLAGTYPYYGADDKVVNTFLFNTSYDHEDNPQAIWTVNDKNSQRTFGEKSAVELNLRGIQYPDSTATEIPQSIRAVYQRMIAALGTPRRIWEGEISTSKALTMDVGRVYTVSSDFLRSNSDTVGVSSLLARLIEIDVDLGGQRARVKFQHYGTNGVGWNASLSATSAPSATGLIVAGNSFTDTVHPVTGADLEDLSGFAVGNTVQIYPQGDEDNPVVTVVTGLNTTTNRIGFAANHNLTSPWWGYVVPATYNIASANFKVHAFQADVAETLGTAADDGHEYS